MKLLIDFGAIKTGGGVQLATNFLNKLDRNKQHIDEVFLLIPDTGPLASIDLSGLCDAFLYYPDNYVKRKLFEMNELKKFIFLHSIDTVYTFFGAGLPRFPGVRSVVSVAYPIICYPDSPYWKYVSFLSGLQKRIVNMLRRHRIRKADLVVVETDVMAHRMHQHVGVNKSLLRVIPPSPSLFIEDKPYVVSSGDSYRILLLSGLDPHKNLWRLPSIALALKDFGCHNFIFTLSVEKHQFLGMLPKSISFNGSRLEQHFDFVGAIPADEIGNIYNDSDLLLNISDLESFSNNYMEAWKSGLPLVCSDTDFARNICGESAIYIDPHNATSSAAAIKTLMQDLSKQRHLADTGKERLTMLPNAQEKFDKIIAVLNEVAE